MELIRFVEDKTLSLTEKTLEFLEAGCSFSDLQSQLKKELDQMGSDLLQHALEAYDQQLRESKARKQAWSIVRRNDPKSIVTPFGNLNYERTYFCNKRTKEYSYLVDEKAGIAPHSRITDNLKAELVAACGEMSYEKATDHLSRFNQALKFSRQTACNCVKEFEPKPREMPATKRTVDELYVEADEDHLKVNGRSAQARLVYFHEGVAESPRRHLVNAVYFATVQRNSEEFWYEVLDYIDAHYDLASMQNLFLSGDGANWIKSGREYLPNSTLILDQFHLFQAIRTAIAHAPKLGAEIRRGIRKKDKEHVMKHLARALELADEEPRQQRVMDVIKYIDNNWSGIENGVNNPHVGCSAEGHVSHILSARLSSRPMSWSKLGAEKMASIRSIRANGESVQEHYLAKCQPAPVSAELKGHAKKELKRLRKHRQKKFGRQGLNNAPVYSGGSNLTRKALKGLNGITAF